jgi:DNA-binding CsgD family transcriptional regulator
MRSRLAYRPDEPPGEEKSPEAEGALTELAIELMRRANAAPQPVAQGEGVLMDVESDGVRCVLVRTAPRAAETPLLSPREQEIARMVARGLPNKTIAAVLEISTWTVGTYLRRMFAKLGVTSRAAMVAKLMQR